MFDPSLAHTVEVVDASRRLLEAAASGTSCVPVRDLIDSNDVPAAYAVQSIVTAFRVDAGSKVVGRKIGLTSRAVREQLGVQQPDFGSLFDDMMYRSGASIPLSRLMQPRVEAELAFVLADDLAEGALDYERVRSAIDYAVLALEICDSRIMNWDITLADTICDNASAGAFVLGRRRHSLHSFEPAAVRMTMQVNGIQASQGTGEDCMGDPLLAVLWLAEVANELGVPLRRGEVILSGALGPMSAVNGGSDISAHFEGMGSVGAQIR